MNENQNDKLRELTAKLYDEGFSKGKKEADELLSKAKKEAAQIIENAKEEASTILKNAHKESEELRNKAEGDIKIASSQTLASVRQKLENAITLKSINTPINNALSDSEFLQSIIKIVVEAFGKNSNNQSLDLILPESKKGELDNFLKNKLTEFCNSSVDVAYSRDIANGFKVSQKGEGYFIDFTNNSFEKIISEYIRPKTRKLLFGE